MGQVDAIERNKSTVRRLLDEVVSGGNLDLVDELFAEDAVDHTFAGDSYGRQAVKDRASGLRAAFSDFTANVEHLVAEGDMVALRAKDSGTHDGEFMGIGPTGLQVSYAAVAFFRMRDGVILERWIQPDLYDLLRQLGAAVRPDDGGAT